MPVYEYQCKACSHEFEREQRITEDPIQTCPKCKAPKARRMISRTSFVLKGGGWYSDLYSSSGGAAKPASEGNADAKGDASKDSGDAGSTGGGKKDAGGDSDSGSGGGSKKAPAEKSGGKSGGGSDKGAKGKAAA